MRVHIIETKTGKLVADIPVVFLQGGNLNPTEKDAFDMAWKCAVDDKSVDPAKRADYTFGLIH